MGRLTKTEFDKLQLAKKRKIKIGIDGGNETGVAIRTPDNILHLHTMDFWTLYDFLKEKFKPNECAIYFEDPSKNKPVFVKKYDPKNVRTGLKIAQDVGRVKEQSDLLMAGLERNGFLVIRVRPKKKKWSHKLFCKHTGWPIKESTNEHQRDAARLILKR